MVIQWTWWQAGPQCPGKASSDNNQEQLVFYSPMFSLKLHHFLTMSTLGLKIRIAEEVGRLALFYHRHSKHLLLLTAEITACPMSIFTDFGSST